jgi:hypothetical protein
MGKRQARAGVVSGLSSFLHAFEDSNLTSNGDGPSSDVKAIQLEASTTSAPSGSALKRSAPSSANDVPKAKKRKETFINSARSRFDASALVPRYTDASQVPDHLQKCASPNLFLIHPSPSRTQTLPSAIVTSRGTMKDVCSMRLVGLA